VSFHNLPASIHFNGAILLGENFVADAHFKKKIRIVTHAHADHMWGLKDSIRECEKIIATPLTIEIIKEMKNYNSSKFHPLEYEKEFIVDDERIKLYPSSHVPGAAQILYQKGDLRIVYTGDFKKGTEPLKCDILVMEATYGNPRWKRSFEDEIEEIFLNFIQENLKNLPILIFGYHGKLQEVLSLFKNLRLEIPILTTEKIFRLMRVYERFGFNFPLYYSDKSEDGIEFLKSGKFIGIFHMSSKYRKFKGLKIILSGWQFDVPIKKIEDETFQIALSDHADFNGLLHYVEESSPSLVITDNYRVGDAPSLARAIQRKLGIKSIPMP